MLTIILVVGYFLFCVGMAFFLDYRTKKRKLNETAVEYSTGKNSMGLFMAFSLMWRPQKILCTRRSSTV